MKRENNRRARRASDVMPLSNEYTRSGYVADYYSTVQYLRSLTVQAILDVDQLPARADLMIGLLSDATRVAEFWEGNDRAIFTVNNNIFSAALKGMNINQSAEKRNQ
jgi:hypothetical protein